MNTNTKREILSAVNGFVGDGREAEVAAAIRATSAAEIRAIVEYLREDGETAHPENVVYQIAARNGIYW